MDQLKVLHIIPELRRGGAERICIDICSHLQKNGHDVIICLLRNNNDFTNETQSLKIHHTPCKYSTSIIKNNIIDINSVQKIVNNFKPNIVHSHLYEADLIAFELATNNSTKFFSHIHSNRRELLKIREFKSLKEKIISKYERRRYLGLLKKKNVKSIAISKDCHSFSVNDLKQKDNTILLQNCINHKKFKGEAKRLQNPIKLISIGTFNNNKNQQLLIKVCSLLLEESINFHLTFLGDGPTFEKVKELAIQGNIIDNVSFLGSVEAPEKYLKESNILLHSSKSEAFGLVLIEAMASGVPVITTNGGGNKDLILNGKNGFILEGNTPIEMFNFIKQMNQSSEDYFRMSQFSIDFSSKFDIEIYINSLIQNYLI